MHKFNRIAANLVFLLAIGAAVFAGGCGDDLAVEAPGGTEPVNDDADGSLGCIDDADGGVCVEDVLVGNDLGPADTPDVQIEEIDDDIILDFDLIQCPDNNCDDVEEQDIDLSDAVTDDVESVDAAEDTADESDSNGLACFFDSDCKAMNPVGDPCSAAICQNSLCVVVAMADGAACDDNDPCTDKSSCQNKICVGSLISCNDNNPCTDDTCSDFGCVNAPNSVPCNDNNACTIGEACAKGSCGNGKSLDCEDKNVCTADACDAVAGCTHEPLLGSGCSDDNPCTLGDFCQDAGCLAGKPKVCSDNNPCTDNGCDSVSGNCTIINNKNPCDDGSDCTLSDVCDNGTCGGSAANCDDKNFCTTDSCTANGGCVHTGNKLPCDDNNPCSEFDECTNGACSGFAVNVAVFCDDGNACTTDVCDAKNGCVHNNNAIACDDGNLCTKGDVCAFGVCLSGVNSCSCTQDAACAAQNDGNLCNGTLFCDKSTADWKCKVNPATVVVCDTKGDGDCTQDVCNKATGKCGYVPINEGKQCDADGTVCTPADICAGGKCVAGPLLNCNDGNPCTTDSCNALSGCKFSVNSSPCSDGNACTIGDVCKNSACVAGIATVCTDGNSCTDDTCDGVGGGCIFKANATPCDDGNACSQTDVCKTGLCSGIPVVCDDKNICTNDSCSPKLGCVNAANSIACDDGSACTTNDTCGGGACKGIAVVAATFCDDSNPCTTDVCDVAKGCLHNNNSAACDDGNGCTVGDVCSGGKCASGTNTCGCAADSDCAPQEDGNFCNGTLFCDKSALPYKCKVNPKTVVTCDGAADTTCLQNQCDTKVGKCGYQAVNDLKPCDADASVCTVGDQCKAGVCVAGGKLDCNDSNGCSDDACDAKVGCTHVANGAACSDANPCTVGDVCKNNACVGGAGTVCNDSNPCTTDSCNAGTGVCVFANNSIPCNDNNACSQSDVCAGGVCGGVAVKCDDGNLCTNDSCNALSGCVNTPNAVPCFDGNACTANDVCAGGICKGVAINVGTLCDDGNACTNDNCDPTSGCTHVNNTAACDDANGCTTGDVCAAGKCTSGSNTCACAQDSDCAVQEDGNFCNGTLFCNKVALPYKCVVNPKTIVTCDASADTSCTKNTCAVGTGKCGFLPINEGNACDADGSVCTVADSCKGGVCASGSKLNCDDGNLCSDDACNSKTGCTHVGNASPCSDGNACTVGDACANSGCAAGPAAVCNDGNGCTADSCDKITGKCLFSNNSLPCDDGSACSQADTCVGGGCVGTPANCNDGNLCTNDSCNPKTGCVNTANTLACNDGNACTINDICGGSVCAGTGVSASALCDDGNPCTTEACDPKTGCLHNNNAASCDDGNGCTTGDACAGGKCVSGVNTCGCAIDADCASQEDGNFCNGTLFCDKSALPYACNINPKTVVACDVSGDTPCSKTSCVAGTGKCLANNVNNGGPCDADGSVCTVGDTCAAGLCKTGLALNCDDGNPCSDDSCDSKLGCAHKANLSPCTDGNACTVGDGCAGNACVSGVLTSCVDGNVCTTNSCDKATGACVFANNALPCDDNNKCSQNDVCGAGICAGSPVNCNDGNVCTSDSCTPAGGCANAPNTLACSDGNPCTTGDTCGGGACTGVAVNPVTFCDDGNGCTNDACNAVSGCVHANNSAVCDDGNGCTVGDTCSAGLCASGVNTCGCTKNADCAAQEDGNLCNGTLFCDISALPYKCKVSAITVITCDPSADGTCAKNTCAPLTGICDYVDQNEGLTCNADSSVCSVGDACKLGACLPGPLVNCNDSNVCTDDACNALTGCNHVANASPCDDGNACTVGDICNASGCVPSAVKNCNDGNPCTTDSCTVATGACANANNANACDDGNACTNGDKCGAGSCAGVAISCNDGNVCTDDACDVKLGCTQKANTLPCNDNNACTTGDSCAASVCAGPAALNCNDGNPCTSDSCNLLTGCVNVANTASCDDGNACTSGDVCAAKVCAGGAVSCNDGVFCTSDTCNVISGCVYSNNTLPCDDLNACTTGDTCTVGACKGSAVVVATFCNDNNACTTDSCNTVTGCQHANNVLACDDGNGCTTGDACAGGVCVGGANTCACTTNADCAGLEDGNFCNGTLFCDKSALPYKCNVNPATVVTCNAAGNTLCKANTCTPATGVCAYAGINSGGACNADNNVCTNPDVCSSVNCVAGAPLNCDDGNSCTNDACDAVFGCTHANNAAACSDGNGCTVGDVCKAGACTSGALTVCNDNNPCTIDSCNVANGSCQYNAAGANGLACDADGSVCTVGDACNGSNCKAGPALNCDDLNGCTNDSCNAVTGCVHVANAAVCNDNNACTGPDICAGGACAPPAVNCNDNNACTTDTCAVLTGCAHANVPDKTSCAATSICFTGVCTLGKCGDGVLMPLLGEQCDDGNVIAGDGCGTTCLLDVPGCADGTREGTLTFVSSPAIAQCSGNWTGWIGATGAGTGAALCGSGYHLCGVADAAALQALSDATVLAAGCWVINAANHKCKACTAGSTNEIAAIGGGCPHVKAGNAGCTSNSYDIDGSLIEPNGCTRGAANPMPLVTGVLCCKN